jgi:hypothetical protein
VTVPLALFTLPPLSLSFAAEVHHRLQSLLQECQCRRVWGMEIHIDTGGRPRRMATTQKQAYARVHIHTCMCARTHAHSVTHTHTILTNCPHTHKNTQTHTSKQTQTQKQTLTNTRKHRHTHKRARARATKSTHLTHRGNGADAWAYRWPRCCGGGALLPICLLCLGPDPDAVQPLHEAQRVMTCRSCNMNTDGTQNRFHFRGCRTKQSK